MQRRWLRSAVLRLLAYPAIAYLTVGAFLYFRQDALVFPAPREFEKTTPAAIGLQFEDLRISVNAASLIHAWWIPAENTSADILLVFHGNGYVLEDMVSDEVSHLHAIGLNLLLVDYRGYGLSTSLRPNESTVNEDAEAALRYLLRERGWPMYRTFVLGRSIGSGPATYLASKSGGLGGLILESPFSSVEDVADRSWLFGIYPLRLLLRTHFDNLAKISSVRCPVLVVSGSLDALTPVWMPEKLFAHARNPKQLYLVPNAGHNDLLTVGGPRLTDALREFVREER